MIFPRQTGSTVPQGDTEWALGPGPARGSAYTRCSLSSRQTVAACGPVDADLLPVVTRILGRREFNDR